MVAHSAYKKLDLIKLKASLQLPVLVDGRNLFDLEYVLSVGLNYRRIGMGK